VFVFIGNINATQHCGIVAMWLFALAKPTFAWLNIKRNENILSAAWVCSSLGLQMRQINTRSTAPSKGGDSASSLAPVPASLQQYVSAPYTISLPGSKVKPGPHNLAALAATATRQHMLWLLQQSKAGAGAGQLPTHHMILASGGAAAWAPKARHMSPVSRGGDGGGTQGAAGHTVVSPRKQARQCVL
jgi:hypothetical protein